MKPAKQFWITIFAAVGIDYLLAKFLASDKSEVIFIFLILLFAPMLFALKSSVVRYVLWKIVSPNAAIEKYHSMMVKNKWLKPDAELEDAMHYLQRNVEAEEVSERGKIVAAQLMGAIQALFDTQQVMSAWAETSAFKSAMKKYEKEFS